MTRRVLVLDAAAGASGDMFAGALIGAGAAFPVVREHVLGLGVARLDVRVGPVVRGGVAASRFEVFDPATGRAVDQGDAADRGEPHRGLGAILSLLRAGQLPTAVRVAAAAVFERLAAAEAEVHGVSVEAVHFHEVGALDAIADVVAGASALWQLGVEQVVCSPVHVGCGTVRCAHGNLPVPAPATAALLRGVPAYSDGTSGELCTPTGAALLRQFCHRFGPAPELLIEAEGCGAGSRELPIPNVLRATVGQVGPGVFASAR
ncbi:MAG: LarC family nickel insertion protein [Deferrisomatales bacterium]|nr:LarC family nickel insertion protein [Deferrisomatales bacterium]